MASAAAIRAWEICFSQGAGFLRALASEGVKESSAGRVAVRAICISASITWWKYSVSGLVGQEGYIHRIGGKSTEEGKKKFQIPTSKLQRNSKVQSPRFRADRLRERGCALARSYGAAGEDESGRALRTPFR